jgi:hypothetical protein
MKATTRFASIWMFLANGAILVGCFLALSSQLNAQCSGTQGQNGVYNPTCNGGGPGVVGSPAFIDASMFATTPPPPVDFCKVLNWVLTHSYPAAGAVIDARGLNSSNTNMTCLASPWAGITSPPPSTILLPATGATTPIVIPSGSGWVLPNKTRLIGEGDGIPSNSLTPGTTIQAASGFSGTMIQFGSTASTGIAVEHLTLDGQGQAINGISNAESQANSYVDHVSLYRILGIGLSVTGTANDSGPYSNIIFDLGGVSGTSSTVCAKINGPSGTRGIHGLSCTAENNDPPAAVLLDSSNNSIEDVRIVGFYDGIRVGANNNAQSNVLLNIIGDTNPILGGDTPIIVVHIFNVGNTVSDLGIMGANNVGGSSSTITIQDDVTSTSLVDTSVGIYALGEAAGGGHSRFTTSPNAVHWAVGTATPTGTGCTQGSLYSCTNASGGSATACGSDALSVCGPSGWVGIE